MKRQKKHPTSKENHQPEMNEENGYWGDKIEEIKNKESMRIGVVNINGIPATNDHRKNTMIRNAVNKYEFDIMGITETNRSWRKVEAKDRIRERTRDWWNPLHTMIAYNKGEECKNTALQGGVLQWSIDKAANRIVSQESGLDPSGMGRWVYSTYQGKNGMRLKVVTMYRPKKPNKPGEKKVYAQQLRKLLAKGDRRCPTDAILEDLEMELRKWKNRGDQIIVMGDFNEDVRKERIKKFFDKIGMQEAILNKHGEQEAPPTYHRGSYPIDGIFVTKALQIDKCGYLGFGRLPTDHRGLWIQVTYKSAFGNKLPAFIRPQARRLQCQRSKTQKVWIKIMKEIVRKHNLNQRAEQLLRKRMVANTKEAQEEYEKLDKISTKGKLFAEKKCRKLKMGAVPYSPKFRKLRATIRLWEKALTRKKGARVDTRYLKRLEKKAGETNSMKHSIEVMKRKLKRAIQKYKLFKPKAEEERDTWVNKKVEEEQVQGKKKIATRLKVMREREKQRVSARRIKWLTNINEVGGGIHQLEIYDRVNEKWELTQDKSKMIKAGLNETKRKLTQAKQSPCMIIKALRKDLGKLGNGDGANMILQGKYVPKDNLDEGTLEFIKHLAVPTEVSQSKPISTTISTEEWQWRWKKIKETTSSGISGIHFGHMKTAATDDILSDFEANMASIPFQSGYSPKRWRKGTNVFLRKKPGDYRVTKQRNILLLEADYNFNNKLIGSRIMKNGEKLKSIAKEQYGSRKSFTAIDHALNKRLYFDILRQTRKAGALCSNDAKSCYDRINLAIASLCMRRLGMPLAPIKSMIQTLLHMKHSLRTSYGDSDEVFDAALEEDIHGIGQGNGAAPTLWATISTVLLNMLRSKKYGATISSAFTSKKIKLVGFAFVDDTDIVQTTGKKMETLEKVCHDLQKAIDLWEGGLKATGGALVPEKSFWYGIEFEWEKGRWKYCSKDNSLIELSIVDEKGARITLERKEFDEGEKTLGVFLAPDGNNKDAIKHMREMAEIWQERIRCGQLPKEDAWKAVNTTIMMSLKYPLLALTLNEKECKKIVAPVLKVGLPMSEVNRHFPHALVYAPTNKQGLGLTNLYDFQGASHVECIQKHSLSKTITGDLIKTSLEYLTLEVGISGGILMKPYSVYGVYATNTWLTHTWKFMEEKKITMMNRTKSLTLRREYDSFIMESIIQNMALSPAKLKAINRCRSYLKVTTLADIVTGDGVQIVKSVWKGKTNKVQQTMYNWPKQTRPENKDWTQWKKALRVFTRGKTLILKTSLGRWIDKENENKWKWYYQESSDSVFKRISKGWQVYRRIRKRGRRGKYPSFQHSCTTKSTLLKAKRCTITWNKGSLQLTGTAETKGKSINKLSFDELFDQAKGYHMMKYMTSTEDTVTKLILALRQGTVKMVTDGSYYPTRNHFGTAACIIELGGESPERIIIWCIVSGPDEEQCSHRSELAGILSGVKFLQLIEQWSGLQSGQCTIACDGEGAIKKMTNSNVISPVTPHFDILSAIKTIIDRVKTTCSFEHVYGHQDDKRDKLTELEELNVQADILAKDFNYAHHKMDKKKLRIATTEDELWPVFMNGSKIVTNTKKTIITEAAEQTLHDYWISKKGRYTHESIKKIDWEGLSRASKKVTIGRRIWVSKFSHNWVGNSSQLARWGYRRKNKCPLCGEYGDTTKHIPTCCHVEMTAIWLKHTGVLYEWMRNGKTAPSISQLVRTVLEYWHNGFNIPFQHNKQIQKTVENQGEIGWCNFLTGVVDKNWGKVQDEYFKSEGSRKTGKKWVESFIIQVWKFTYGIWIDRNKFIHQEVEKNITTEIKLVDKEIVNEWEIGISNLGKRYNYLFSTTIDTLLATESEGKKKWLTTILMLRKIFGSTRTEYTKDFKFIEQWLIKFKGK